jgi:hypothetical protein
MKCPKCYARISLLGDVRREFTCRNCGVQLTSNTLWVNSIAVGVALLARAYVKSSYCSSSGSVFSALLPPFCGEWVLLGGAIGIGFLIFIVLTRIKAKY